MMIRREAKESFTWVHNTFIRDKRLSLAERGMLILLMSLPNDWKFTIAGIKSMVEDGREKVSSTLKALEKHGYLRRVQQYDENGGFTDSKRGIHKSRDITYPRSLYRLRGYLLYKAGL